MRGPGLNVLRVNQGDNAPVSLDAHREQGVLVHFPPWKIGLITEGQPSIDQNILLVDEGIRVRFAQLEVNSLNPNRECNMNGLQRALTAFFFAGTILVVGVGVATSAQAEECHRVHGRIQSTFTTTNCASPIGLCTEGMITGAGPLDSATTFLALDAAPSAGMPAVEPAANLSYSGVLTIKTRRGTLVTHDLGVLDVATTSFTEIERPASGTGIFANVSSVFFISGALVNNGTGFDGELYGELCTAGQ